MSVLVIGDSHVGGLAPRLRQLLPGVSTNFQNGAHTAQLVGYTPSGDVVVVALGTNDISKGRPASETLNAARAIVQRAGNRRVLWALPPPYNTGAATINAIRQSGAEIIESLPLPLRDGWHTTSQGYQQWADVIAARVNAGGAFSNNAGGTWLAFDDAGVGAWLAPDSNSPRLLIYALLGLLVIKIVRG